MKKTHGKRDPSRRSWEEDDGFWSPAEIREIERRAQDLRDPVRYMLVSEFSRHFILYYNVSDDVFAMNNRGGGTLFKRRETAECIRKLLGKGISIVKYTKKKGELRRLSPYRPTRSKKRRGRGLVAVEKMQRQSVEAGTDKLSLNDINAEIQAARKARHR